MGVHETSEAAPDFLEVMQFRFYSLSASLLLSIFEWFSTPESKYWNEKSGKDHPEKRKIMEDSREKQRKERIAREFVMDACDSFIPGSVTGRLALGCVVLLVRVLLGWIFRNV